MTAMKRLAFSLSCGFTLFAFAISSQSAFADTALGSWLNNTLKVIQHPPVSAQPPLRQQQNQTTPNNQTTNATTTPEDLSASKELGKDEVGPDIMGLRIGTTLQKTRAIIKSRFLLSPMLKKNYAERPMTLAYSLPGEPPQPIPNENYYQEIGTSGQGDDGEPHRITVSFSPVPGHEEAVRIHRTEEMIASQQPIYSTFLNELVSKYGTPTISSSNHNELYWLYDQYGKIRPRDSLKENDQEFISNCVSVFSSRLGGYGPAWIVSLPQTEPNFKHMPTTCGAILLTMVMNFRGVNYTGPNTFVQNYDIALIGIEAAIRASHTSLAIVDEAREAASNAAIKAAQQRKPNL